MCVADTTRDTTYHIAAVNGSRDAFNSVFYSSVKSVLIDSVCVSTRIEPAHKHCVIKYDAQNLMGAMVRETQSAVITTDGRAMMWDAWWYECKPIEEKTAQRIRLGKPLRNDELYLSTGEWVDAKIWQEKRPLVIK